MKRFEFATATRVIFGEGTVEEVASLAAERGERILVVTGSSTLRVTPVVEQLKELGKQGFTFRVPEEPTTTLIMQAVEEAREAQCDVVVGFGGGSALDAGKAIAMLLANGGKPMDYLEVIGKGEPITKPSVPYIAVPTTAGTGAEATRNAVLVSAQHGVKVSLRSPWMLPQIAVVDPTLTYTMPAALTASTGMDALSQLIEPYVCNVSNPLTDTICREGIFRVACSLRMAFEDSHDIEARHDMALASLFGGMALANAKLGAVHGFAGPIGGHFSIPHGVICARLLPIVMEANINALMEREPESPVLGRYNEIAQVLTGEVEATGLDGARWVRDLCADMDIPPLAAFGVVEEDFEELLAKGRRSSSMKGNPLSLTDGELMQILEEATNG